MAQKARRARRPRRPRRPKRVRAVGLSKIGLKRHKKRGGAFFLPLLGGLLSSIIGGAVNK